MEINWIDYKKQNLKIGAVMLIFLGVSSLVSGILSVPELFDFGFKNTTAYTVIYELSYSALYFCMFFIPMIMYKIFDKGYKFTECMPCKLKFSKHFFILLVAGLGINYVAAYINAILMAMVGFDQSVLLGDQYPNGYHVYNFILDTIKMAIVPAFVEELLFRGLVLERISRYGRLKAMVISSLLFALMHQNPAQFFYTFILGMFLSYMAIESGSIWGCIVLHFVNNFTSVIMTAVQETQPEGRAMVIICIMELVIAFAGLAATLIYFKKLGGWKTITNDEWLSEPLNDITKSGAVRGFFTPTIIVFIAVSCASALLVLVMGVLSSSGIFGI